MNYKNYESVDITRAIWEQFIYNLAITVTIVMHWEKCDTLKREVHMG